MALLHDRLTDCGLHSNDIDQEGQSDLPGVGGQVTVDCIALRHTYLLICIAL